jgi:hypothetical protein
VYELATRSGTGMPKHLKPPEVAEILRRGTVDDLVGAR